ncbi:hypothetical protein [Sphingobium sp. Leaf26]|uniref:hypothetical protein n=1 Tax=Sphingobium sp. Leaf26 TaxID=1735693 RepID=UPI0012E1984E|nr:hypothetical protein [Sphingobium sp. Leaf26]
MDKSVYGYKEHVYAAAFADTLRDNSAFLNWLIGQTIFADRNGCRVLWEEMTAKRPNAKFWWKNYWTGSCACEGCSGSETDIFVVVADDVERRFALHIEVKQPTDRFDPLKRQGQRYRTRALCWAGKAPKTVPAHEQATTILLFSELKRNAFIHEIAEFDVAMTFESVRRVFPTAVPLDSSKI